VVKKGTVPFISVAKCLGALPPLKTKLISHIEMDKMDTIGWISMHFMQASFLSEQWGLLQMSFLKVAI
jgi:hypothetical protein